MEFTWDELTGTYMLVFECCNEVAQAVVNVYMAAWMDEGKEYVISGKIMLKAFSLKTGGDWKTLTDVKVRFKFRELTAITYSEFSTLFELI